MELWSYAKLLLKSLYFNSLTNADTMLDCAFEPVYWIVDNVTRWFGVVSCWDFYSGCFFSPYTPKLRSSPSHVFSSLRCLSVLSYY